jgi:hypothetical protein
MSMSLAALEILEQADFPPGHARAIARAIEADSTARWETLATKSDLASDIGSVKSELVLTKSELKGDIAALRGELKNDLATLKSELKTDLATLKGELRVEMRDIKGELLRWIFLAVMAQTAASGGLMYFLLNLAR